MDFFWYHFNITVVILVQWSINIGPRFKIHFRFLCFPKMLSYGYLNEKWNTEHIERNTLTTLRWQYFTIYFIISFAWMTISSTIFYDNSHLQCTTVCVKTLEVTSDCIFWVTCMILQFRQKIWVQHGQKFRQKIKALGQICDIFNRFRANLSNLFTSTVDSSLAYREWMPIGRNGIFSIEFHSPHSQKERLKWGMFCTYI